MKLVQNTYNIQAIAFDVLFISLGAWAFYNRMWLLILGNGFVIWLLFKTNHYHKDQSFAILDAFIDFLNHINANLSVGMGFERSISASSNELKSDESYAAKTLLMLDKAIKMGIQSEDVSEKLREAFPINESELFSRMLLLSKTTGADPCLITGITLDKLYLKHKVKSEIEIILYQKKLEQTILCLAPMMIVLFIRFTSPDYMEPLYNTVTGLITSTFAFALIVIMKLASNRIIHFEV